MHAEARECNGPLLRLLVSVSTRFSSEWRNLILNIPYSFYLKQNGDVHLCADTNVLSDSNISPTLSMCTVIGYSKNTTINNKTT